MIQAEFMLFFSSGNFLKCLWMFKSSLSIYLSIYPFIHLFIYLSMWQYKRNQLTKYWGSTDSLKYRTVLHAMSKKFFWSVAFGSCFTASSQMYRLAQWFTSKRVICTRFVIVTIEWMDFFGMNSVCCRSLTKDLFVLSKEESLKFK